MPMPAAMAAWLSVMSFFWPLTQISPASAL